MSPKSWRPRPLGRTRYGTRAPVVAPEPPGPRQIECAGRPYEPERKSWHGHCTIHGDGDGYGDECAVAHSDASKIEKAP